MKFVFWIVIGGIAGWVAERVTKSDHGLLMNIVVGIVGAFIGGWIFTQLGISVGNDWIGSLITAIAGALVLLYGLKFIRGQA